MLRTKKYHCPKTNIYIYISERINETILILFFILAMISMFGNFVNHWPMAHDLQTFCMFSQHRTSVFTPVN